MLVLAPIKTEKDASELNASKKAIPKLAGK
jgi:hypothetical protein